MKQQSLFASSLPAADEMTALALVESIFNRVQPELPSNVRRVTRKQLNYLRDLIDAEYGSSARVEAEGKLTWLPAGPHKYLIAEDRFGDKHTVMRLKARPDSAEGCFV